MRLGLAALLLPALVACGGDASSTGPDWSEFDPSVKTRIDQAVEASDCAAMQKEFDNADSHGHSDLMVYLDDELESAGCY